MKYLKKFFKWTLISIAVLVLLMYVFDYGYILRGVRVVYFTGHNSAFIDDFPYFENDIIELQQQNLVMQENLRKLNLELLKEKNKESKVNFHNSSVEAQKVQTKMGMKEQQPENQFTLKKIKTMPMRLHVPITYLTKKITQTHATNTVWRLM